MTKRNVFRIYMLPVLLLFVWVLEAQASVPDSLRVRWINGRKYTIHKVSAKETWSSISRRYDIGVDELMKANPGVDPLKVGQIINVPVLTSSSAAGGGAQAVNPAVTKPEPKTSVQDNGSKTKAASGTHVVKAGETLYRIATQNGMKVDELKALNGLTSNTVSVGQRLKIVSHQAVPVAIDKPAVAPSAEVKEKETKSSAPATVSPSVSKPANTEQRPAEATKPVESQSDSRPAVKTPDSIASVQQKSSDNVDELPKVYSNPGTTRTSVIEKDPKSGIEIEKVTEVGVATWIEDGELNQNKFYALHRTAQIGTIIKITNRMNNNSVFVKVVGVLPETGDNENVIIKVTQAAAQRIGALDKKFTAELSYGISR